MTVNKFNRCQESLDNDGQQIQQMSGKFRQWRSTNSTISTKGKTTSHL